MRYTERRVAITGLGVVSPNGRNKDEFWNSVLHGISGIKKITSFDTAEYSTKIAGIIDGFDMTEHEEKKAAKRMSRSTQLAVAAAKQALKDSGIVINGENRAKISVIVGVSVNGFEIIESQFKIFHEKGPKKINPFTIQGSFPNAAAANITINLGIKGRSLTISTGCSSALNAIGHAYELIKYGNHNIILCGGAEAPVTPSIMGAFCMLRSLSRRNDEPEKASRPFDKNRDGYILSEAASMFVVESMKSARARNARVYGEIIGYGNTTEALSMYHMDESGDECARTMAAAMKDANIKAGEVDYISAHGSSSPVSDVRETRAIKRVFNGSSKKLKISSIKSMIGHPLGVAGALQLAATVMSGNSSYIHPTINYNVFDPECDLDYVPNEAIRKKINVAVINSFGLGGNNAVLAVRFGG